MRTSPSAVLAGRAWPASPLLGTMVEDRDRRGDAWALRRDSAGVRFWCPAMKWRCAPRFELRAHLLASVPMAGPTGAFLTGSMRLTSSLLHLQRLWLREISLKPNHDEKTTA